jgi:hypothetical protein
MRSDWTALPEAVTAGIVGRIGGDLDVVPASSGNHAEIASTVTGPAGTVFVKAASAAVQSLRYELAAALKGLQATPALGGPWFTPAGRLAFEHPAMGGVMVVHSDLNPANLIVTAAGLRIVDWAWATKGAPWVELALLVQWLIGSGHTPEQAEAWLAQFPAWTGTDREVLDHFASTNAAKWSAKARQSTTGWVHDLAAWTGDWTAHRNSR